MGHTLCIGLVAYTQSELRTLKNLVEVSGYIVGESWLYEDLPSSNESSVDSWIVNVDSEIQLDDAVEEQFDAWLADAVAPIIFCDGQIPLASDNHYRAWARRLRSKLVELAGTISLEATADGAAQEVWVLAASTGGPASVKQFISELPPKLDVGFIYVQHIEKGFDSTLVQMLGKYPNYPAKIIEHGDLIRPNEIAIVPPEFTTELIANKTFVVGESPWIAPYSPSADSILADVAHCYRENCGMIVFSGMGDDGAAGSRMVHKVGGKIWAQTPTSCTSSSMPEACIAAGYVEFKGNPFALAQQLMMVQQNKRYSEMRNKS